MNKRLSKILLGLTLLLGTASIGFGSYMINDKSIGSFSDVTQQDANIKHKVTLNYQLEGVNKTSNLYVNHNDVLTLTDMPVHSGMNGRKTGYITWKDTSTNAVVLDPMNDSLNKTKPITKDMTLTAVLNTNTSKVKETIKAVDSNKKPNVNYSLVGNSASVNENVDNTRTNKTTNDIYLSGNITGTISLNFKHSSSEQKHYVNINAPDDQVNKDTTIGLDDPTVKTPTDLIPNGGAIKTPYNPCISRVILDGDLILGKGAQFNVGAYTAFYGDNPTYSQHNMQGFIVGQYSEVDLNGHNLIVQNGAILEAWGVIKNSRNTGRIIVENGGRIESTLVIEWNNLERSMPVQYIYGGQLLDFYRMPYLTATTEIKHGGKMLAYFRYDCGGAIGLIDKKLNYIGPDNSFVVQTSPGGRVERYVSFDKSLVMNEFAKNNLMNQKVLYKFIDNRDMRLNILQFSALIQVTFDLDFSRGGYYINRYMHIHLINTKLTTCMNLTFAPGSYLFVDENSIINLESSGIRKSSKIPVLTSSIPAFYNQSIGGLNFAYEYNDFTEGADKYFDDYQDNLGNGGGGRSNCTMLYNAPEVYSHDNLFPAHCDMLGQITFQPINNYQAREDGQKYYIGGEINIADIEAFKTNVANSGQVKLYASSGRVGPCCSAKDPLLGSHRLNISDYYTAPLVSNGNVLTDFSKNPQTSMYSNNRVREDYATNFYTYNPYNGLVTSNTGSKYAFFHVNGAQSAYNESCIHLNRTMYTTQDAFLNGTDDYYGAFFPVATRNSDRIVTPISKKVPHNKNTAMPNTYIFFRGSMLPFVEIKDANGNVSSNEVYISKLRGVDSNKGGPDNRAVKYVLDANNSYYHHDSWRFV